MPAEATYPLRQRVLRPHQTVDEVRQQHGNDHPHTATFAALTDDGSVIATASVRPERCPWLTEREGSWRLRGMATDPARQGQGLGAAVLDAALAHVATSGAQLVWCNARTPALSFYLRAGFVPYGQVWEDPQIGPHLCMWREVASAQGGDEVGHQVVDRLDADAESHDVTRHL